MVVLVHTLESKVTSTHSVSHTGWPPTTMPTVGKAPVCRNTEGHPGDRQGNTEESPCRLSRTGTSSAEDWEPALNGPFTCHDLAAHMWSEEAAFLIFKGYIAIYPLYTITGSIIMFSDVPKMCHGCVHFPLPPPVPIPLFPSLTFLCISISSLLRCELFISGLWVLHLNEFFLWYWKTNELCRRYLGYLHLSPFPCSFPLWTAVDVAIWRRSRPPKAAKECSVMNTQLWILDAKK